MSMQKLHRRATLSGFVSAFTVIPGCSNHDTKKDGLDRLDGFHLINLDDKQNNVDIEVTFSGEVVYDGAYSLPANTATMAGSREVESNWPDIRADISISVNLSDGGDWVLALAELRGNEFDIDFVIRSPDSAAFYNKIT